MVSRGNNLSLAKSTRVVKIQQIVCHFEREMDWQICRGLF